jgi:hypothetical protein
VDNSADAYQWFKSSEAAPPADWKLPKHHSLQVAKDRFTGKNNNECIRKAHR